MKVASLLNAVALSLPLLAQPEVVISGLQTPHKVVVTPRGNLLVSETSLAANSGRVSLVSRSGARQSLLEGLPSGTDVTGGSSGPNAMALTPRILYLAMGAGDTERRGTAPNTSQYNPAGPSSPLFVSVMSLQFNREIDALSGTFRLTVEQQRTLNDNLDVQISDGAGGMAIVRMLARFPVAEAAPGIVYRFSNPWGLALSEDNRFLYMTDGSMNSLTRIDTRTGRWERIVRFPGLTNPSTVGPPVIDAVPTSVRVYGDELLVSFLTGFPFSPGYARVLSVNPRTRATSPFIYNLTSAVDVLWRPVRGQSEFYVLEFSTNQSAQPPAPGVLLRVSSSGQQAMASNLQAPVSLAYDEDSRDLYILELTGRLLRMRLP